MKTYANPQAWMEAVKRLARFGADDVYFYPAYAGLYAGKDAEACFFLYEKDGETFFMPYLKKSLSWQGENYFDFETPYGYGGPVASTADPVFLNEAWKSFYDEATEQKIIAGFLRLHPLLNNHRFCLGPFADVKKIKHTVSLKLDKSEEDIAAGYKPAVREKIKKAAKSLVRVEWKKGVSPMLEFARHYRKRMTDVSAGEFYFFSDEYFMRLAAALSGHYELGLAFIGSESIGGILALASPDYAHIHLSAVDEEHQKTGAAVLLRHEAIRRLREGRKAFHFGGGTSNSDEDALFKFKSGFSGETSDFYIGSLKINPDVYDAVCREWQSAHPEKAADYSHLFLKYRM